MHEKIFSRVIIALAMLGLVGSISSWLIAGPNSVWVWPSAGLLLIALAAWGVWFTNRFKLAAYLLITGLTGLVAGLFWHKETATGVTPYLFIPITLVAGLIFGPVAPILTLAGGMLATALVLLAVNQQFFIEHLQALWVPFSLNMIVTLLAAELSRYIGNLQQLSAEKNRLLRHYSQKSEQALQQAKRLQQRVVGLEHQLNLPLANSKDAARITKQKNRLYALLNGAIQELNNTIGELEQIIESLEELPKSPAQTDFIEEAWKKIHHLTNLVVSLEEIAKLENNQVKLQYRDVDIATMIRDVISAAQGLARNKDVTLRYELPSTLPSLQADPLRLRQALLQLMSNAVKYTDEGLIKVDTEVADDSLTIRISDTGIGINPDETDLIFDNFTRSREPMSRYRRGPGLGLAISKKLVELHGGDIRVSSTPGIGSTFHVTLPFTPPKPAPAAADMADTLPSLDAVPATPPGSEAKIPPIQPEIEYHHPLYAAEMEATAATRRRKKGRNLGPVARFGPRYVMRFGLALLSMLLLISIGTAFLAFYNRSPTSNAKTTGDAAAGSPTAPFATATGASYVSVAASVTSTTAGSDTSALLPVPTASPTASPSPSPTASPTITPPPSATATVAATPRPSPTPMPSPTNSPTPSPTATTRWPTPVVTATPLPTFTAIAPTPPLPPLQPRQLSYLVSNSNGWHVETIQSNDATVDTTIPLKTGNHNRVDWAPQRRLIYAALEQGVYQIFTAQADGSQIEQITQGDSDNLQPSWSPNGQQILFSSGRTGNFELFSANADGSNVTQLTNERGFDEWPVWSPTGDEIAFVSDRDGNEEIYVMNSDGSNVRRLTNHPADDWPAAWSPNGEQLVFASNRDGNWNLFIINSDGRGLQRLTNDPANEREPVWAADGRIAFASDSGGNWDIYMITPGPAETPRETWTQLTSAPTDERYPNWLP